MARPVTRTYKKVLDYAAASRGTAKQDFDLVVGIDSVAMGQTGVVDATVPTGVTVNYIEVQLGLVNLASTACFIHTSLQYTLAGQSTISPNVVGGDPQRNQVLHQTLIAAAKEQNVSRTFKFKIPNKFSRVREGMSWHFTYIADQTHTSTIQVIYKTRL